MRELIDRLVSPPRRTSTKLLGALMLCVVLIAGTLPMAGCSGATVAQDIVNWTPALQSAASTVASIDPVLLPEAAAFVALSSAVDAEAKAYLANPGASLLAQLQTAIVTAQQQANASLLTAAKIVDQTTQKHVLAAIGTYATIINTLLSLIGSISSKTAGAAMASASTIKLASVEPYLNRTRAVSMLSDHYRESMTIASAQADLNEAALARAGF